MKKFCKSWRQHAVDIINVINKKMETNSNNHTKMQKFFIVAKKNLNTYIFKIKNIVKLGAIVIIKVNMDVLHMAYKS